MRDKFFLSFTKACYKDRFLFLIVLIVMLIVLAPFIQDFIRLSYFIQLFFSIIFITTIYAVSQKRKHIIIAVILSIPTILALWSNEIAINNTLITIGYICGLILFAFVIILILMFFQNR